MAGEKIYMQTTSHLLMIRPVNFSFNAETAVNNAFQVAAADGAAQEKALAEFEGFVKLLRDEGVDGFLSKQRLTSAAMKKRDCSSKGPAVWSWTGIIKSLTPVFHQERIRR